MRDGSEEEQEENFKPYAHQTLLVVKSSQNQNGLRHNDYARYHHYCVRKIHRLRKTVKFLQQSGNKKKEKQVFTRKLVEPEQAIRGEKYLEILVFKMEGEWAYAQDMKKAISELDGADGAQPAGSKAGLKVESQLKKKNVNEGRNVTRMRVHARKRL